MTGEKRAAGKRLVKRIIKKVAPSLANLSNRSSGDTDKPSSSMSTKPRFSLTQALFEKLLMEGVPFEQAYDNAFGEVRKDVRLVGVLQVNDMHFSPQPDQPPVDLPRRSVSSFSSIENTVSAADGEEWESAPAVLPDEDTANETVRTICSPIFPDKSSDAVEVDLNAASVAAFTSRSTEDPPGEIIVRSGTIRRPSLKSPSEKALATDKKKAVRWAPQATTCFFNSTDICRREDRNSPDIREFLAPAFFAGDPPKRYFRDNEFTSLPISEPTAPLQTPPHELGPQALRIAMFKQIRARTQKFAIELLAASPADLVALVKAHSLHPQITNLAAQDPRNHEHVFQLMRRIWGRCIAPLLLGLQLQKARLFRRLNGQRPFDLQRATRMAQASIYDIMSVVPWLNSSTPHPDIKLTHVERLQMRKFHLRSADHLISEVLEFRAVLEDGRVPHEVGYEFHEAGARSALSSHRSIWYRHHRNFAEGVFLIGDIDGDRARDVVLRSVFGCMVRQTRPSGFLARFSCEVKAAVSVQRPDFGEPVPILKRQPREWDARSEDPPLADLELEDRLLRARMNYLNVFHDSQVRQRLGTVGEIEMELLGADDVTPVADFARDDVGLGGRVWRS